MSEKPLQYQDGWLAAAPAGAGSEPGPAPHSGDSPGCGPGFVLAELQLGERVAARVDVPSHPVLDVLRKLPIWGASGLPEWMRISVSELYTGRIGGVVQRGRYLVQRSSGSIPERVATRAHLIMRPRERAKQTVFAGVLGLGVSMAIGVALHVRAWVHGAPIEFGRRAWPTLLGWMTLVAVFLTPAVVAPCYGFANSFASTACVVTWMNLLLYGDLFSE